MDLATAESQIHDRLELSNKLRLGFVSLGLASGIALGIASEHAPNNPARIAATSMFAIAMSSAGLERYRAVSKCDSVVAKYCTKNGLDVLDTEQKLVISNMGDELSETVVEDNAALVKENHDATAMAVSIGGAVSVSVAGLFTTIEAISDQPLSKLTPAAAIAGTIAVGLLTVSNKLTSNLEATYRTQLQNAHGTIAFAVGS